MKTKAKYLFERVTDRQIPFIWMLAGGRTHRLYKLCIRMTGFPSVSFLSKQEAGYVIDCLKGPTPYLKPFPPRTAEHIPGETSHLPYFSQVMGIRNIASDLKWNKNRLKSWLKKYFKVRFRELDRKRARDAFVALQKIQSYPYEKAYKTEKKRVS